MADDNELLTAQTLAEVLNLSVDTIWKYTREKKIPYVELGSRQYRYRLSDVVGTLSGSSVGEKFSEYETETNNTEPKNKLSYQDYLELPEEPGYRFEVLDGVLIKEPSPNVLHQRVSRRLQRILEDYFWKVDPEGEIFDAPLDVTFQDISVVQPDLFYVSGKGKDIIKHTRINGAPTLIIEIISPTNSRKDRLQKLRLYQKVQVQHYWIANPEDRTLEYFALREGSYALIANGMDNDVVEHPDFAGLSIELKSLW